MPAPPPRRRRGHRRGPTGSRAAAGVPGAAASRHPFARGPRAGRPDDHRRRAAAPAGNRADAGRGSGLDLEDLGDVPESGFSKLGLSAVMLRTLHKVGYSEPTPVQEGLIPRAMAGIDVMGQAADRHRQDGRLRHPHPRTARAPRSPRQPRGPHPDPHPRAGRPGPRRVRQAGGRPPRATRGRLRRQADPPADRQAPAAGVDIVVGTPGRVLDHMGRGNLLLGASASPCWTRPTGCWTSASGPTSRRSSAAAPRSGRRCC